MTITELKYIVALAKEKHFGKAAEICFVSQPTLSVGVKKLEDELNVVIFERAKNHVQVTPIGKLIIEEAKNILTNVQKVKDISANNKNQLNSTLNIGCIYTVAPYLFPELIMGLNKIAPDMPVYVVENFTDVIKEKLLNGDLDVVIAALPFDDTDIVARSIYIDDFVAIAPLNHKLSKQDEIELGDLHNCNFLMLSEGHCFRDQLLQEFKNKQLFDYNFFESNSVETIKYMVASGIGISIIPTLAVKHNTADLPFKVIKIKNAPQRTIVVAWRATFARIETINVILEVMGKIYQNE